MPLLATPGASNANSYLTEAEAETYFDNRLHAAAWSNVGDAEQALVTATQMLDWYMQWKGVKATSEQALEWPRTGVYDTSGTLIESTVIPSRIKQATCELALFSVSADRLADQDTDGYSMMKVGPLTLQSDASEARSSKRKPIPKHIRQMLSNFIINPPGTARLIRG